MLDTKGLSSDEQAFITDYGYVPFYYISSSVFGRIGLFLLFAILICGGVMADIYSYNAAFNDPAIIVPIWFPIFSPLGLGLCGLLFIILQYIANAHGRRWLWSRNQSNGFDKYYERQKIIEVKGKKEYDSVHTLIVIVTITCLTPILALFLIIFNGQIPEF